MAKKATRWVQITKRTEDPKLAWLQCRLAMENIPSRRSGFSFHGPLMEVPEQYESRAWEILSPVDNIRDDAPRFRQGKGCDPAIMQRLLATGYRLEEQHMRKVTRRLGPTGRKIMKGWRSAAK